MKNKPIFVFATILYKYFFPIYNILYSRFKKQQDKQEIEMMRNLIKPGNQILDIGANIGFYAKILSKAVGAEGEVHCFEPDNQNFKHLISNTQNLENVVLNKAAVSDTEGELTFYTSHRINVDHRSYQTEKYHSKHKVKAITIDGYVNGKFKVDGIKMDIQGAEFPALCGMRKTLAANPDLFLFMELWPDGLLKSGSSVKEVFEFFTQEGFRLYHLYNGTKEFITADILNQFSTDENEYYNIFVSRKL